MMSGNLSILYLKKSGFEWSLKLENDINLKAFFWRTNSDFIVVGYVLPQVIKPYVRDG